MAAAAKTLKPICRQEMKPYGSHLQLIWSHLQTICRPDSQIAGLCSQRCSHEAKMQPPNLVKPFCSQCSRLTARLKFYMQPVLQPWSQNAATKFSKAILQPVQPVCRHNCFLISKMIWMNELIIRRTIDESYFTEYGTDWTNFFKKNRFLWKMNLCEACWHFSSWSVLFFFVVRSYILLS